MPYIKTPWIALKKDDILDAIVEVIKKVNAIDDLNIVDTHLRQKADVTSIIINNLMMKTEIGKRRFYNTINKNWKSLPDHVKMELQKLSILSDTPPSYLLNYGDEYETAFANVPTDPLDHLGFTVVGSLWRDSALSNLHYTFTYLSEYDPALFATLMLTKKGQELLNDYAFATHPIAYIAGGFIKITISDIFTTLEIAIEDLGSTESLRQMLKIMQYSMKEMNPFKAFLNSHLLRPKGIIRRDRKYIKSFLTILSDMKCPVKYDKYGDYFFEFFKVSVPKKARDRVPPPENIDTKSDVINYAEKLVSEFSPLIAGVGSGLFKTVITFLGRFKRVLDRIENLAKNVPEEIIDLVISIVRKITGVPTPVLKAAQRVHQSNIKINRINQNE